MIKKDDYNKSYILELSRDEIEILKNVALQISVNPNKDQDMYCSQVKYLSKQIPQRIQTALRNLLLEKENVFLVIKKIEIIESTTIKTPDVNTYAIGSTTLLACIQSLFISIIGEMISYEAEGGGSLFQDIVPVKNMGTIQTSYSSDIELEIHTEQAFSKIRPDILSLACIRGDENAFTYILPVQKIIDNISDEEYELLCKPLWKTGVDLSFKINGHEFIEGDIRGPFPIISGSKENPTLIFDQDLMVGITEESNKIIKKIVDIYYKNRIRYNLKSGEIILIDNRRAVHGRSSFKPKYDGYDRFLIRCFGIIDYESTNYARPDGGRMVSAIYS
jgi:L-asparagine oxygenase